MKLTFIFYKELSVEDDLYMVYNSSIKGNTINKGEKKHDRVFYC